MAPRRYFHLPGPTRWPISAEATAEFRFASCRAVSLYKIVVPILRDASHGSRREFISPLRRARSAIRSIYLFPPISAIHRVFRPLLLFSLVLPMRCDTTGARAIHAAPG